MSITNRRTVKQTDADFYLTPEWGTEALLKYEEFTGNIWEPACGDGAMSRVLERHYPGRVVSTDIIDRGYGHTLDFLSGEIPTFRVRSPGVSIITNPPFNLAEEFITQALKHRCAGGKVCMLLRAAFLEGSGRYQRVFSKTPPQRIYIFTERLSMYPADYVPPEGKKKSGGTTAYAWFVWHIPSLMGTQLYWIEPGLKPNARMCQVKNLVDN